ncbi:DUF5107 domain-containing protein [Anaerosporobacter sp.]|uniref:DUF5107 domain-containing protein n=1 Tax=Anaerosporobacter sp. TaxID=1872529 RepID=UPI00286EFBF7|nr:DUF5107 domain-containing protein [Anaerosporobacter sp.]
MSEAKVWIEKVMIPTYEIGEAEKNPMFLDKRVYQGSSGKVYPYPTVEKISDVKVDKEYTAVYLENEYLKVMVLPELGGRIQRAYDKTNDYDFVYYNHVIKPALVGLIGPWISGGIEFNWPQHHRPTTYLPVDFELSENEDGSKSVLLHDVDQMYGTKGIAKFTLYPGKAYIEITGQLYNRTAVPQTFLWWANPAVPVNDNTQSIFPPDVHAVMDHGKRDVSRFPIATGVYYKQDYSEGVDISRYKNIPVPTSYMAEKSKYDFVGGYDYGKEAGILHVADHHISPGKKQWTWGCGDFGKAWDRNLTDEDGPYVELMTGVYTDNQPDFTWLKPFEEKTFTQYFMPYKAVGQVKNATKEAAVSFTYDGKDVEIVAYATGVYENAEIILKAGEETILREIAKISPVDVYRSTVTCEGRKEEDFYVSIYADGKCLVEYKPEKTEIPKLPEPAKAAKEPEEVMTCEELYLTGLHIEQYRHATYLPDPYYLEGLKRDPGDIRLNNAYGSLLMRRGQFAKAETYFNKALERMLERSPNPYDSESYYLLGLTLFYQGKYEDAYDSFYKATWSNEQQEMSFYYLAAIDAKAGKLANAYAHIEKALVKNAHNIKARGLKAYLLRQLDRMEEAAEWVKENLMLDPFDFVSCNEQIILSQDKDALRQALNKKMRNFQENYLMTAKDYAEMGAYKEAVELLRECTKDYPMLRYYEAYYLNELGEDVTEVLKKAEACSSDYCFPNKLEDIAVLQFAITKGCKAKAPYYLGNLFYDKLQWEEAVKLWETSANEDSEFATVHRNLSLVYYNKMKNPDLAKKEMEKAFALNTKDVRIFLELDQLYKKLNWSFEERLENYEAHRELIEGRDDLYIEYISLVNMCGRYKDAYECIMNHNFHSWEGGEGKITTQYKLALLALAKESSGKGQYQEAEDLLRKALVYPENLGEGKLEGTKDNDIYYNLGLALEAQGKTEEAEECFTLATIGTDEPAGAMFYNDQPADMILYQGLSYLKLGKTKEAKARFYRLIDYGEQHLEDEVKIGYFAVSLPDFLIFEENYTLKNRVHCYYLIALGNIGLGDVKKAEEFLKKAVVLEPSHMMCRVYEGRI